MANPTVVNSASTQGGIGSSQALTMPASIVAGRLLLAFVGTSGSGAGASTVVSGWSKLGYCEGPTPFPVLAVFGKVAVGGDSGTVTGGTTTYRCSTTYQITNWSGSLADIAVALMSTAALDPPALSGLTAKDYLCFAAARHSATLSAAPSGYSGLVNASTTGVFLGTANKALSAGTGDDPGVFGGTSAAASIALTLAVAPVPVATLTPAQVLSIGAGATNHFSVQVARTGDGSILTKSQADIEAGYSETPYFVTLPGDTVVQFNARADGPTTAGATSARCELREAFADGTDMGFSPFDGGVHTMHGRSKITHHPTTGASIDGIGIMMCQLQNGTADRVCFRTQYVSGTMRLRGRVNGTYTGTELATGTANATGTNIVGVEYEWKIVAHDGNGSACTVDFYLTDMVTPAFTSTALAPTGSPSWYFKAGSYNQFNATNVAATEYGQVELRDLLVSHVGGLQPPMQFAACF